VLDVPEGGHFITHCQGHGNGESVFFRVFLQFDGMAAVGIEVRKPANILNFPKDLLLLVGEHFIGQKDIAEQVGSEALFRRGKVLDSGQSLFHGHILAGLKQFHQVVCRDIIRVVDALDNGVDFALVTVSVNIGQYVGYADDSPEIFVGHSAKDKGVIATKLHKITENFATQLHPALSTFAAENRENYDTRGP
jgi:hypothetical protein